MTYKLPDLDYDYSALEPYISAKIMELHHSKHHAAYVAGANAALEKLADAREKNDFACINQYERDLSFNLSGHINHSIFWKNLTPNAGQEPTGDLKDALDNQFGSFDAFKAHFSAAAAGIQGSGWAALTYDKTLNKLLIEQYKDQQGDKITAAAPLLLLDMWEHAFYLQYLNVKADYIKAVWNIINWQSISDIFNKLSL